MSRSIVSSLACLGALLMSLSACGKAELESRVAELETEVAAKAKAIEDSAAVVTAAEASKAALEEAKAKIETIESELADAETKLVELEGTKGALEGELKQKEAALEAVQKLQDALSKSLIEEIETGDVRVSQRGGFLVVDVSDSVLFATGEAELSERGQKVITRLAESLKQLPDKSVFQVGGHTDNQPIKSEDVLAKFPTNWELSAARATNVVRFLEESCEIPGERLVAAGFSEFRPVASNKKPKNRAKNRRIEIALLPPKT